MLSLQHRHKFFLILILVYKPTNRIIDKSKKNGIIVFIK
jgi:hypothetical protein